MPTASRGGQADFNDFVVSEPRPRGLTRPVPLSRFITLTDLANGNVLALATDRLRSVRDAKEAAAFRVVDRGRGRIALQTKDGRYVSVEGAGKAGEVILKSGKPGDHETFQWVDLQRGETLLLSLATHRYLAAPSAGGVVSADHAGPDPGRRDGSCFKWTVIRR